MRLADVDKGSASWGVTVVDGMGKSCQMTMRGKGEPRARAFRRCAGD